MRDDRAYVRGLYYHTAVGHVLLLQSSLQKALVVRLARRPAILPLCHSRTCVSSSTPTLPHVCRCYNIACMHAHRYQVRQCVLEPV